MRVLIVNGHSPKNAMGNALFAEFESAVRSVFKATVTVDVEVVTVLRSALKPYLYVAAEDAGAVGVTEDYTNKDALALFDRTDFIFVDGDPHTPPWAPAVRKLFILLRMCYMTGKAVFGTTFALQTMGYLCATNGRLISVINGTGEGGAVSGFPPPSHVFVQPNAASAPLDVCLDSATGDAFVCTHEDGRGGGGGGDHGNTTSAPPPLPTGMRPTSAAVRGYELWTPHLNIGLCKHAESMPYRVETRQQATTVKASSLDVSPDPTISFQACTKLRQHYQHWLFGGLTANQFFVPCKFSWDLRRPPSATDHAFDVLAEIEGLPAVIEYGHTVCVKFHVAQRYAPTLTLLRNYVHQKYGLMLQFDRLSYLPQAEFQQALEMGSSLAYALKPALPQPPRDQKKFDALTTPRTRMRTPAQPPQPMMGSGTFETDTADLLSARSSAATSPEKDEPEVVTHKALWTMRDERRKLDGGGRAAVIFEQRCSDVNSRTERRPARPVTAIKLGATTTQQQQQRTARMRDAQTDRGGTRVWMEAMERSRAAGLAPAPPAMRFHRHSTGHYGGHYGQTYSSHGGSRRPATSASVSFWDEESPSRAPQPQSFRNQRLVIRGESRGSMRSSDELPMTSTVMNTSVDFDDRGAPIPSFQPPLTMSPSRRELRKSLNIDAPTDDQAAQPMRVKNVRLHKIPPRSNHHKFESLKRRDESRGHVTYRWPEYGAFPGVTKILSVRVD